MIFLVEVSETLSRVVKMNAPTSEDAIERVEERYRNEKIVLNSSDFTDVSFNIVG